jgi:hypothetical protein
VIARSLLLSWAHPSRWVLSSPPPVLAATPGISPHLSDEMKIFRWEPLCSFRWTLKKMCRSVHLHLSAGQFGSWKIELALKRNLTASLVDLICYVCAFIKYWTGSYVASEQELILCKGMQ